MTRHILVVLLALLWGEARGQTRDVTIPDPAYTPGVSRLMTVETMCTTRWGTDRRFVTTLMRRRVFANYRLIGDEDESQGCKVDHAGRRYELDHLVPRSLGGADDVNNLWPQCYSGPWNAVLKDRLEVRAGKELCAGHIDQQQAHEMFTTDWRDAYRRYFGEPQ
jgi:hypothetical protein